MNVNKSRAYLLAGGTLVLGLMVGPAAFTDANAARLYVTSGAGSGCTLPRAIENANDNATTNPECPPKGGYLESGPDKIFVQISTLVNLKDDMQTITGHLIIQGEHDTEPTVRITGASNTGGTQRLFWVEPGVEVEFRDISLINATASGGSNPDDQGGCVYNDGGIVTLVDNEVRNCQSTGDGGAVYNAGGEVTFHRTVVRHNVAGGSGGAVANRNGVVEFKIDSECRNNRADGEGGGGCIDNQGAEGYAHIRSTLCAFNDTTGSGGCLNNLTPATARIASPESTVITGNEALDGGGIYTDDATLVEIKGNAGFINGNTPDNCEVDIVPTNTKSICD